MDWPDLARTEESDDDDVAEKKKNEEWARYDAGKVPES